MYIQGGNPIKDPSLVISFISIKLVFVSICPALQKAGKHMEDSVVAAYVALLLGCILQENEVSIKGLV